MQLFVVKAEITLCLPVIFGLSHDVTSITACLIVANDTQGG
jgi:hypothetical protein